MIELNKPDQELKKTNWLYIISPCMIAAVFAVVFIVDSYININQAEGWSYIGVLIGIPFLISAVIVDVLIKLVFTKKALYIWLIELAALPFIAYFSIGFVGVK